jgi:hypothetical protein
MLSIRLKMFMLSIHIKFLSADHTLKIFYNIQDYQLTDKLQYILYNISQEDISTDQVY